MSHAVRKNMYALKVTRFANAPVISAGVMIANIIWYAQKTIIGIDGLIKDGVSRVIPRRKAQWKFPRMPKVSVPLFRSPLKQSEKPNAHHSTVVQPMDTKLWIMIARTFLRPTRPP